MYINDDLGWIFLDCNMEHVVVDEFGVFMQFFKD
jgi:hypothetical protein